MRDQSDHAHASVFTAAFYFHPSDKDPPLGTPEMKKPLSGRAFRVNLLRFCFRVGEANLKRPNEVHAR